MLSKLRRSMTFLCAGITGMILVVMSIISLVVSEEQLNQRGEATFRSNVNSIALRLTSDQYLDWNWLLQVETDNRMIVHIEDSGSPLLFAGNWQSAPPRMELVEAVQQRARDNGVDCLQRPLSTLNSPQYSFVLESGAASYRATVLVMRTDPGFVSLTVLEDLSRELAGIRLQRLLFASISLVALLLLLGFSWWFSGRAVAPIVESSQRQAEFIAAASHELRTPLAVMRTSAAALEYELGSTNEQFTKAIERECARSSKLVDDLLMLANADAKTWSVFLGPVEMEQVIMDSVESFSALSAEKRQELRVHLPATGLPILAGDENRLSQLLGILLDNACRHTPESGRITVSAERQGRAVRIAVADNGPGVPAEHRDHLFDRFYRVDDARTKKEHYGLGLSIAKEIVRLHKGKIFLSETPGGGLTVAVELPLSMRGGLST